MKNFILVLVGLFIVNLSQAQAGISVSPGRLYYKLNASGSGSQYVSLTNPTDKELEVGVSFSDWEYEPSGNNKIVAANTLPTSCTDWIQILPSSYFVVKPGETKQVEVLFKVPANADSSVPVHTGMIFFTQLNPGTALDQNGAAIQVTVRMGVKVYHSFIKENKVLVDFVDFTSYADDNKNKVIELKIENQGDLWTDGKVKWELFNNSTGKKSTLKESEFYTLPKDIRILKQQLPSDLAKGNYTVSAILTYGENDVIKIAELEFSL
ncbi:fimbrial biogenesis chaperone [Flavobacterium hydatis]|jgi:hypothetical protein|uniref:Molecular chaperone n=1 Tax=Flavobacterium hydatis TaxID=991 RepID=A0A086AEB4_FLAHY|nr:hypothetical protein [Flavobacterium hydatis]KFF15028.1 hypothetical protein IW20_15290 [Flavobacterium hydatis]OXA92020.1 hypothetical protein B0A62_16640 [Flavobacterium hydatis]